MSSRPISPLIYGNFIELGLGRQSDGMRLKCSITAASRTFRPSSPPFSIPAASITARKAMVPRPTTSHRGYETDQWYRSGPSGKGPVQRNTFSGFFQGKAGAAAGSNVNGDRGIAQDGLYVKAGTDYRFFGYVSCSNHKVNVKLVEQNDPSKVIASTMCKVGGSFTECSAVLKNRNYTGKATFRIEADKRGYMQADGLELWRSDSVDGSRNDCLTLLRKGEADNHPLPWRLLCQLLRLAVGRRQTSRSHVASQRILGRAEPNDLGTDEFLDLCKMINAEPQKVVNMLTGTPRLAADWVEYCNGAATTPMGKFRRKRPAGAAKSHVVGNGQRGLSQVQPRAICPQGRRVRKSHAGRRSEYQVDYRRIRSDGRCVRECWRFADRMWTLSPTAIGVTAPSGETLRTCRLSQEDRQANRPCQHRVDARPSRSSAGHSESEDQKQNIRYHFQRWFFALNLGRVLQKYWQNAEWYDLANFNDMVNTMGLSTLEASKSRTGSPRTERFLSSTGIRRPSGRLK